MQDHDQKEVVDHILKRQIAKSWQLQFEEKNLLSPPDEFCYHAFIKKVTALGIMTNRFIIISQLVKNPLHSLPH